MGLNISLPAFGKTAQVLDPHIKILQRLYQNQKSSESKFSSAKSNFGSAQEAPVDKMIGVFVKTQNVEALRNFLEQFHGKINSIIGDIVTVQLPLNSVSALKNLPGVDYVELAQPVQNNLNTSLALIRGNLVHSGTPSVPTPYRGTGVIVGIVDTGIDWKHSTFMEEVGFGNTRVKAIWDQSLDSADGFVGPREIVQTYGLECLEQDLVLSNGSLCPSKDRIGHGTHVAGIAAGNYSAFKGVAPKADIIAVKLAGLEGSGDVTPTLGEEQSFSNHVVDGVNYIFQKAAALGKPAVVNLSLGTHFGPHDSTSLFEQALNNLVDGREGRSIVVAAGNENHISGSYFAGLHAGFALNGETRAVEMVSSYTLLHGLILDVWQPADSNLSFGIGVDNYKIYETTSLAGPGNVEEHVTEDGGLRIIIDASETANPLNGKKHCVIYIAATGQNDGVAIAASKYTFDLIVSGRGDFDAWIAGGGVFTKRFGTLAHTGFTYQAGDSQHTIGVPATASHLLSVASYVSRNNFNGLFITGWLPDLGALTVGNVSSFSSIGPTVNPSLTGQKPEITAPGEWILSAMSSAARAHFEAEGWPRSGDYVLLSGTSMAAPHVTGAVALLLERDPTLTAEEIKQKLCEATVWDATQREAVNPNNRRGYGRLDIFHAMTAFNMSNYVAGGLVVSNELVPELPYDGGITDGINNGRLASVSKRDPNFFKNVNYSGTDATGNIAEDPLESPGGGCSLIYGSKRFSPFYLFPLLILLVFLIGLRSLNKRFAVLVLLLFLANCGGVGGEGESHDLSDNNAGNNAQNVETQSPASPSTSQTAPIGLLSSLSLSNEQAQVFLNEGWIATVTVNSERTRQLVLFLPLTHFFAGETISLGADGLYGLKQEEGFLAIYEGTNLGNHNPVVQRAYISTSGSVTLSDADIKPGSPVRGSFRVDQIVPLDLNKNLLQRESREILSLNSDFSALIYLGGTNSPLVLETSPKSGAIGTRVRVKGFNLGEIVTARFSGSCSGNLPSEVVSDHELMITIDRFGCESQNGFNIQDRIGRSVTTENGFEIQIPYLQNFSVSGMNSAGGRLAYDSVRQSVYFPDTPDRKRLRVFSLTNNTFLRSIYLDEGIFKMDTTLDGRSLFGIHNYYGPNATLFSLENIGDVNALSGGAWSSAELRYVNHFFLGKGRRGLLGTPYGMRWIDLDAGSVADLPELRAAFGSYDTLLRSTNREYIILNSGAGSSNPDVVYHALGNGSFEKLASAFISQKILGVAEQAGEIWSARRVYNTAWVQQAEINVEIPDWDLNAIPGDLGIGIVFDPSNTYALFISKRGVLHIFDRATRAPLVLNVAISNVRNRNLNDEYFMTNDGSKLVLTSGGFLHVVDLVALFERLNLPY